VSTKANFTAVSTIPNASNAEQILGLRHSTVEHGGHLCVLRARHGHPTTSFIPFSINENLSFNIERRDLEE
jgi:hypothetical protein